MTNKQKAMIVLAVVLVAGAIFYFIGSRDANRAKKVKEIKVEAPAQSAPVNDGNVSPISGLPCENWNRRPLAVMQASDVPARPDAGLSEADMVVEMPVITASITRLMAVYICNTPAEVGSMRSARHDFVHLAKGMDAIFAHWGRADIESFKEGFNNGMIDNLNCNNDAGKSAEQCCFRKEGMARGVDSGYGKPEQFLACAKEFGYRTENQFVGYPHQAEAAEADRPATFHLRVAFAGPFAAEYDYDKTTNAYRRTWGNVSDTDRNDGKQVMPKNIAVLEARSEQIEGQYNNVQLGDPWYDTDESGQAHYFFNGKHYAGSWKKDKSKIDSKLFFFDESGQEIKFVPGQIWVDILEPGQALNWTPAA